MAPARVQVLLSKMLNTRKLLRPTSISSCQLMRSSTETQPKIEPADETPAPAIDPLKHPDFFGVHKLFTVKDLFDARVHYGHKEGSLNDTMRPFIFGSRLGYLIFDLDQTAECLRQALNFAAHIAFKDGIILFICRNPQNTYIVDQTARECGEFSHTKRWRRGTFTNSEKEFQAVTRLPDLCIFLSTFHTSILTHFAVRDAAKMAIPTIAIADTNCNPNIITYPVPGNDDSPAAIELYCKLFKTAILRGKELRAKLIESSKQ